MWWGKLHPELAHTAEVFPRTGAGLQVAACFSLGGLDQWVMMGHCCCGTWGRDDWGSGVSSKIAWVRGAFPGKLAQCDAGQVSVAEGAGCLVGVAPS